MFAVSRKWINMISANSFESHSITCIADKWIDDCRRLQIKPTILLGYKIIDSPTRSHRMQSSPLLTGRWRLDCGATVILPSLIVQSNSRTGGFSGISFFLSIFLWFSPFLVRWAVNICGQCSAFNRGEKSISTLWPELNWFFFFPLVQHTHTHTHERDSLQQINRNDRKITQDSDAIRPMRCSATNPSPAISKESIDNFQVINR